MVASGQGSAEACVVPDHGGVPGKDARRTTDYLTSCPAELRPSRDDPGRLPPLREAHVGRRGAGLPLGDAVPPLADDRSRPPSRS